MPNFILTTRDGIEHELEGEIGASLMDSIREGGIDEVMALCGGGCSCATCQIYVDEGFLDQLPKMSQDEDDVLDSSIHRRASSRLACQIVLSDALAGLRVTISPEE
jgi:2Fe-2S ferredoxin